MSSNNYHVGYKKPPAATRFKPGRSGNPKGRPNGTKNFATDLAEELQERITVRDGGKEKKISKQRALIKATVAKALRGETRAAQVLILWLAKTAGVEAPRLPESLAPDDDAILSAFLADRTLSPPADPLPIPEGQVARDAESDHE
jgi:hypothetical protein